MEVLASQNLTAAKLTFVLDHCSCCHMIHIPGHHKLFRSHRHIPGAKERKGKQLDELQTRKIYNKRVYIEVMLK